MVHLEQKIKSGDSVGRVAAGAMRQRFFEENAAALEEARIERNTIKAKKGRVCHCGAPKSFSFRECYTCHQKRLPSE